MSLAMMSDFAPHTSAQPERVSTKRALAAERRRRWQAQVASEKENLTLPANASDVEVLAESYRHAQMRFFVALFDDSLPLGQFVAKSMLVDEYVAAMAFEFLVRSRLDMCLWAENVHFALMLAGERAKITASRTHFSHIAVVFSVQMQDDIDDFGFIEIVKCWVEMHGVSVKQLKLNEFVIDGALIDCFQRAKNQLWRRLEFNLNVAPEVVHSTLLQLKRYYEPSISFPVRTQEHVDYVKELRANQAIRLWIDRTKEAPRAPTTRATVKQQHQQQQQQQQKHQSHSAARGIDVDYMPSPPPPPPPPFGGRRRLTRGAKCSPTESTSTSPQSENNEPSSNRSNYQQHQRANKRRNIKAAVSPARSKARSQSPPVVPEPTTSGMAFLTHFFSNVSGANAGEQ